MKTWKKVVEVVLCFILLLWGLWLFANVAVNTPAVQKHIKEKVDREMAPYIKLHNYIDSLKNVIDSLKKEVPKDTIAIVKSHRDTFYIPDRK